MSGRRAHLWITAVVVASAGLWPCVLAAQGAGAEGPLVLQTPGSIRAAGLNGAGAALVGDAGAVFTNPAGMATIAHIGLEGGYRTAPLGAYQTTGAFALRIRQLDLGFGLKYFDFGSAPEIVPNPATGGVTGTPTGSQVTANEVLGIGSLIYRFGLFAFGGSVKYARQSVADLRSDGESGDIGVALAFFDIAALGFSVQNVGGNWDAASTLAMPRVTRLGFTMNYVDPQETFRLLSTAELQWVAGHDTRVVLGLEGGVVVKGVGLIGRAAYGSRTANADRSAVTSGLSLNMGRLTVDYAYEPHDLLGSSSQQLGLRLTL